MIDDPTVLWNDFRAVCQGMDAIGVPVDDVLARIGLPRFEKITRDEFDRLDGHDVWAQLWEHGAVLTRDPWLPASVGQAVPFGAFEIVDYAATAAASLGESLVQLTRYLRLITPELQLRVDASSLQPCVTLENSNPDPRIRETAILFTLGVSFSRYATRSVGGFEVTSLSLGSVRPPGYPPCPLEMFSSTPTLYGQPQFAFTVSRDVWTRPLDGSSPGLAAVLHRHADELLARRGLEDGPLDRFRNAIRQQLLRGDSSTESVARALGLSLRTLHRRLKEQGWTFQGLLDAERKHVACSRLREPRLSIGEVAYMLGYSEQSSFLRAFRRWTGSSPSEFRATALAA